MTSVHKKHENSSKNNYIPVSIWQLFRKCMKKLFSSKCRNDLKTISSKYQCGLRKKSSAQHSITSASEIEVDCQ